MRRLLGVPVGGARPGRRVDAVARAVVWWLPLAVAVAAIVVGGLGAGSSAAAARGHGDLGFFTVTDVRCSWWLCEVRGDFTPILVDTDCRVSGDTCRVHVVDPGAATVRDVRWSGSTDGLAVGDRLPAIDSGRFYEATGSWAWLRDFVLIGLGFLTTMLWIAYRWWRFARARSARHRTAAVAEVRAL